jgi:glycosyltransferase involved in cell wall biosynthesis
MRVLMWIPSAGDVHGGHRVQLERVGSALTGLGVEVRYAFTPSTCLDADVVHGIGLTAAQIRAARTAGAAVALSPVYWARRYRREPPEWTPVWRLRLRSSLELAGAALAGPNAVAVRAARDSDREVATSFESADVLLPNSRAEADCLRAELQVSTPQRVVPNAVDAEILDHSGQPWEQRTTVLCLARVEPHKNQLGLLRAMRRSQLRVEIAGFEHPSHAEYGRRCHREAGPNTEFLGPLTTEEVVAALGRARVSVLPSWYETTGLSSLEAAAAGANVVTTNRGFTAEYFGADAWYCDPSDEGSIRRSVEAAWNAPPQERLRRRIAEHYTWDHAAAATLQAYQEALARRPRR